MSKPKFKVGDIIKLKDPNRELVVDTALITAINKDTYTWKIISFTTWRTTRPHIGWKIGDIMGGAYEICNTDLEYVKIPYKLGKLVYE